MKKMVFMLLLFGISTYCNMNIIDNDEFFETKSVKDLSVLDVIICKHGITPRSFRLILLLKIIKNFSGYAIVLSHIRFLYL